LKKVIKIPIQLLSALIVFICIIKILGDFDIYIYSHWIGYESEKFIDVLIRTIIYSLFSTFLSISLAIFIGFSIFRYSIDQKLSPLVSIFLFPVLLGNTSIAFIFWNLFKTNGVLEMLSEYQSFWQNILLAFIHCWQYSFLFAFLIWLNLQFIKKNVLQYSEVAKLSSFELIRDVLFPSCRNLITILSVISFTFAFYQDAFSKFIIRASLGNSTELVTGWLFRMYNNALSIDVNFAFEKVIGPIIITFILCTTIYFSNLLLLPKAINFISNGKNKSSKLLYLIPLFNKKKVLVYVVVIIAIVLSPIISNILSTYANGLSFKNDILTTLIPVFIASSLSTTISIFISILLRFGFKSFMDSFNIKSNTLILIIFMLLLIPSILVYLAGYKLVGLFSMNNSLSVYFVWLSSHIMLIIPLLTSFLIATHFSVSNRELDFHVISKASILEIIKSSFLKRFWLQYLLTLIFAFSLIWNESNLNRIFSDIIPSFATNLEMAIKGRASNKAVAMAYYMISISIAFLGVNIWMIIMKNISQSAKQIN
jgi:ABC-type sugar transport system permease subunit